ncbi:hypothetical protein HO133_010844 [Letharia lupina]|uniref:Uncharacterized protein n=1 Tax=Letharia lupina TaxID=560253 RepID=A0A8H6FDW4_9LECA|nr:uncharacterized protein HO133_010844 [Letharia lupina]KAF6224269.1 hypothetical protein HO133_010844 [Letharia lupina]
MELLPIIIIVSLLGFFIILTAGLFTWQYLKAREQHKRRLDSETQDRPTRHLTVRSGQVIPKSEAAETASTRDPASFDLIRPKATYTVKCEAERRKTSDTWPPKVSTHRQDNPSKATDMEAQSKDDGRSKVAAYTWPPKPAARSQKHPFGSTDLEGQTQDSGRSKIAESECFRRKEEMAKVHAKLSRPVPMTQRSGSLTLPRPALVTIESRRPSAAKSNDSQSRQTSKSKSSPQSRHPSSSQNREIAESLQRAYTGPSIFGGEARQLPASPILWNSSLHTAESRRASGRRSSGRSADGSTVSPVLRAPPPSINELIQYETSPPVSSGLVSYMPDTPGFVRDTAPQLDTPDFGNMSFFDSTRSSDESSQLESPKKLQRGVSVMSNRSILTIASSEISSNWTIGNAQVVNIYPSVAQEKDRATPPYARRLRSKYGRFPRGRGDKALPGIPKSPLWQNDFGDVHE